jgi:hypothetical protein
VKFVARMLASDHPLKHLDVQSASSSISSPVLSANYVNAILSFLMIQHLENRLLQDSVKVLCNGLLESKTIEEIVLDGITYAFITTLCVLSNCRYCLSMLMFDLLASMLHGSE